MRWKRSGDFDDVSEGCFDASWFFAAGVDVFEGSCTLDCCVKEGTGNTSASNSSHESSSFRSRLPNESP